MAESRIVLPQIKIVPGLRARFRAAENEDHWLETAIVHDSVAGHAAVLDVQTAAEPTFDVVISLTTDALEPQEGVAASKIHVRQEIAARYPDLHVEESQFYLQTIATEAQIRAISELEGVHMVWPNHEISGHLLTSVETIRASAGWRTFEARGDGISWAVLDTGINASHPHFDNLKTVDGLLSKSFVGTDPLTDANGHGTHVAGIIAGVPPIVDKSGNGIIYTVDTLQSDNYTHQSLPLPGTPSGIAPRAKLISIQVLNKDGGGTSFNCIRGLEYVRSLNQNSRTLRVDGANLSLGYDQDAESYGCGHSPICEEVNRCVNAGISVVVSCGNSGFGLAQTQAAGVATNQKVGVAISISDPANADGCIAVGSTHKQAPQKYGVSYFSSKGPTLDGRRKPDLVAPGEKIYSCKSDFSGGDMYAEMSGTSMAAPHVSGAIAAYLSVRPDFRGDPRRIKEVFKASAIDLGREPAYQGSGFVDAFKALISA